MDESSSSTSFLNKKSNISSLTCAILASLTTGGAIYSFGIYGESLKKTLNLSQPQLETISSASFFAGFFSWIPGLCVDRLGPRWSLSVGGIWSAVALMLFWGVARGFFVVVPRENNQDDDRKIEKISTEWIVAILSMLGIGIFLGCALIIGSVFKIIVYNCGPGTKGSVVGAAKGYVGLGAGTYACLFEALRSEGQSNLDFLPMAAFIAIVAVTIPALLLLPPRHEFLESKFEDTLTPLHFRSLYAGLMVQATVIVATSMMIMLAETNENSAPIATSTNWGLVTILLTVWMGPILSLLFLPVKDSLEKQTNTDRDAIDTIEQDTLSEQSPLIDVENYSQHDNDAHLRVTDLSLPQMLQTLPAWLLFYICTILVGAGTVVTNNLGQMVQALNLPVSTTPASLALFSVAQAASRVATGSISEAAVNWNIYAHASGVPRPVFLLIASLLAFTAHMVLSCSFTIVPFVVGVALTGLAFGMVWPLLVLIVGEVFGTAHLGANYMFYDGSTGAFGTFLLSKLLAQDVYERHIVEYDNVGIDMSVTHVCFGEDCFRTTHIVVSALALSCTVASLALISTTRYAYCKEDR